MAAKRKPSGLTEAAKTLGAKGGKKGGPSRMRKLNEVQRKELARKGGNAKAAKGKK